MKRRSSKDLQHRHEFADQMITSLAVRDFRGFPWFEMPHLGRINLLVGTNNCGKSSLLEAVQLLGSSGDPTVLWDVAARRGERLYDGTESRSPYSAEVDVSHFFHGHEIMLGREFEISANSNAGTTSLKARIVPLEDERTLIDERVGTGDDGVDWQADNWLLVLEWENTGHDAIRLKVSNRGGVSTDTFRRYSRLRTGEPPNVQFISTAGLTVDHVVSMFEEVVLTREEELVIASLRTIEPNIDRIATVSSHRRAAGSGERGGIVVKLNDTAQRIPIGSMGDGLWRMLGIGLAIANAENGILLIDEIDTGLHFSVMDRMWKLVDEASRRLSVQVFATTHSRDCYESLAAIARDTVSEDSEVTLQRIDSGRRQAVAFTEQEIVAAAARGTEVR